MKIIELNETQVEIIENKLSAFDETYITYKMNGQIQLGIEEDGKLIAGLDACVTCFKILYVSFTKSLPFVSSVPIFKRPIFGFSIPKVFLIYIVDICAN